VALPWRILGLHEVAYWREFRRRYGRVEVGAQRDKSDSGGVAPWNWRSKDFAASRRALCEEKRPMLEALNSAASAEAVAQLIAFAGQVERELCNALGRTEETLPGCDSTVREYADRFFRGEAGVLLDHLEHTLEVADEVFRSAGRWDCVADVLNPGAIMSKAHAGALFRMLGLQEVAYWREFERRAWDFNASKVVELADAR
jgi:hypothetical protein